MYRLVPRVVYSNERGFSFDANPSGYRDSWSTRSRGRMKKEYMNDFLKELSSEHQVKEKEKVLKPFRKDIYIENETTKKRTDEAVEEIRKNGRILVPSHVPKPIKHLKELQFGEELNLELYSKFQMPTPIQSQSWPVILSGHDLIGISETGSGKTLGFMLPALAHLQAQELFQRQTIVGSNRVAPMGIIVAPVRELARQINQVAEDYKKFFDVETALFYGGSGKDSQFVHFRRGFHLCIGTPGRLMDFIKNGNLDLSNVSFCVIDEADTMLSMGFYPQIQYIVNKTRKDRQTLLWTATWPSEVRDLAKNVTSKPIKIDIGSEDLRTKENIKQEIIVTKGRLQYSTLDDLFNKILEEPNHKTLVFTNTRNRADKLMDVMRRNGLKVASIHGLKSQDNRERSLDQFRKGYIDFLVATDVASRGLDIQGIKNVVNVDFPTHIVQYIHRIGRTARGEKKGMAYSILTPADATVAKDLIKVLKDSKQEVSPALLKLSRTDEKRWF
ncbi:ATP-dependent RNA helicase [Oopsacas minuta]|uniref:RNA helicase n=1 Tax=Oopsacas minuta TaxID=111878 RepID=A0AAV7JZY7_9METZ|nr:ATP-dependent RNA helicase [Oopsacas minuta]